MPLRRGGNALLSGAEVEARALMREAATRMMLSARAHHRVLKVARTIADLGERPEVTADHVAEALQYR